MYERPRGQLKQIQWKKQNAKNLDIAVGLNRASKIRSSLHTLCESLTWATPRAATDKGPKAHPAVVHAASKVQETSKTIE